MSLITNIQWADSTCNPIMGCDGCELFVGPGKILAEIDREMVSCCKAWKKGHAAKHFVALINTAFHSLEEPGVGHINEVTTTNIHHFKPEFLAIVDAALGSDAAMKAQKAIETNITCYAATLHLNKGFSIKPIHEKNGTVRQRKQSTGYAPTFEQLTSFPDRAWTMAREGDLLGTSDPEFWGSGPKRQTKHRGRTWIAGLPRLIFVSDMGDAFSRKEHFGFIEEQVVPAMTSSEGKRHLWLWLTKRPNIMGQFANRIGGWPENVCAMTTLTGPDTASHKRLEHLRNVPASCRGLSIEPLWDRIPSESLNLDGIDWVILGGESGDGNFVRSFNVDWAREIRDHCKKWGVAFFMKQMGRHPINSKGDKIRLKDSHGGDWDEWDAAGLEDVKIREFPSYFHEYRQSEMPSILVSTRRKDWRPKMDETGKVSVPLSAEEKEEFKKLNRIVAKASKTFIEAGIALIKIRDGKLYREMYATFEEYCDSVHAISRRYAYDLMKAGKVHSDLCAIAHKEADLTELLDKESKVREISRIHEPHEQLEVLRAVSESTPAGKITAKVIREAVEQYLDNGLTFDFRVTDKTRIEEANWRLDDLEKKLEAGKDWKSSISRVRKALNRPSI